MLFILELRIDEGRGQIFDSCRCSAGSSTTAIVWCSIYDSSRCDFVPFEYCNEEGAFDRNRRVFSGWLDAFDDQNGNRSDRRQSVPGMLRTFLLFRVSSSVSSLISDSRGPREFGRCFIESRSNRIELRHFRY